MSALGWAVIEGDKLYPRTVSDTRQAAMVNFLVTERGWMALSTDTPDLIEEMWKKKRREAEVIQVRIERLVS